MKSVVFSEVGQPLEYQETPKPSAGPGELAIKVAACGICGSDLHATMVPGLLSRGQILGHEYAGEVIEVGEGLEEKFKVGDRVTGLPFKFCGQCPSCRKAAFKDCTEPVLQAFDPRYQGAFAEYTTTFGPLSFKLPDNVSMMDAAMIEPLTVGLGAWRLGEVPMAGSILILGAGPIGIALAKWARFFGARDVVVSEPVAARRDRAVAAGATLVLDPMVHENPAATMEEKTGRAPSVIFECVGKPIFQQIAAMCPKGAHIVMCGTCMEPDSFVTANTAFKSPRVSFQLGYEVEEFLFTMEMLAQERITTAPLQTTTIGLGELPDTFEALKKPNDHCKVVVTFD
jgi:(R,R)-butanediol dehydrogenase/meso-butanediol dehydrogenase/diacetyl reductase